MKTKTTAQVLSLLLATFLFCTSFAIPFAKAEEDFPPRTVNLLILYDQSYQSYFAENNITNPQHRLEQMARLAAVPFAETLNITLNVTVASYQSVLGMSYAMQCPTLYQSAGINAKSRWNYNAQCECAGLDDSIPSSRHHNSMHSLLDVGTDYIQSQDPLTSIAVYDAVGIYHGFSGCYACNGNVSHGYAAGLAYLDGCAYVARGTYDFGLSNYCHLNLSSCVGLLWHEFSHTFGLLDGSDDFTTNPTQNCSENAPCIMSGGFDSILYAPNVWCPNCLHKLSDNGGGMAGHYDD